MDEYSLGYRRDGNYFWICPEHLALFSSERYESIFDLIWTFNGGAEKLAKHELLPFYVFGKRVRLSLAQIKSGLVVMILAGTAGLCIMFIQDITIPLSLAG